LIVLEHGGKAKIEQEQSSRALMPEERRQRALELVQRAGTVTVGMLEHEFGISPMTARRDLAILEKEGRVRRTRGGAMLPILASQEDSFAHRLEQSVEAKKRLAEAAAAMLKEGESVFIDCSTTAYHAALRILKEGPEVTILTNSVPVMALFDGRRAPNCELIGIGGSLRKLTLSFVGPHAVATVSEHFADKAFLSVKGLAPEGYLTDPDALEAEVKRAMIRQAREPVLLIDQSKFGERGLSVIAHVSDVSSVLAAGAPERELNTIASHGVEVLGV
jgi:DeoR/GlpR family transcriptional regulator of sugar metabolism